MCPTGETTAVVLFIRLCLAGASPGGVGRIDYPQRGAMEPEVWELLDGRLGMHLRPQLGHIAVSYSTDQGENWTPAAVTDP